MKYTKNQESNFLKKINKSVLSHVNFYFEDDDHKHVDFNGETISFTCQLIETQKSYLYTYNYLSTYLRVYIHLYV